MDCANCQLPTTHNKTCAQCKHMHYCSRTCQKQHWAKHKFFCKPRPVRTPLQIKDIEEIASLRTWSNSAVEHSEQCSCAICARECTELPGMYSPFQILQEYHERGPKVFDNMVQDYRIVNPNTDEFITLFLRPAILTEIHGQRSDILQTGNCIHLGPNGCTLSRTNMPVGCVIAHPCKTQNKITINKTNICKVWMTSEAQEVLELFEKYHAAKNKIVGIKDDQFLYHVRLYRVVRAIKQQNSGGDAESIIMAEIESLGSTAKKDIEHIVRHCAKAPMMAKDYHA